MKSQTRTHLDWLGWEWKSFLFRDIGNTCGGQVKELARRAQYSFGV